MSLGFWLFCSFIALVCMISTLIGKADVEIDNYNEGDETHD